jgi:hypothetical protein
VKSAVYIQGSAQSQLPDKWAMVLPLYLTTRQSKRIMMNMTDKRQIFLRLLVMKTMTLNISKKNTMPVPPLKKKNEKQISSLTKKNDGKKMLRNARDARKPMKKRTVELTKNTFRKEKRSLIILTL